MALNEQQERFCQSYILHRNASEAARAAGYSKEHAARQGHRLLQNEEVIERVTELEQNLTTDVDVISEIEKQYEVARNAGNGTTALKALELLSRVRGNNSETEDVSSESLEKEIIDSMKIIGFEKVFELAAQAFPDQFADEEEYEDDEELLLTEELTSTTDTEAGSNDDT